MNNSMWSARGKPIVVGLALEPADQSLIDTACSLARKLGSPLELVHSTQPIFNYMGAGDIVVNPYYGYDRVVSDLEDAEARQGLERVKKSIPQDISVNIHALRDYTSEALMTIAKEVHAGLILCGMSKEARESLLAGMSTAFSLASHADVPVLIAPTGMTLDFTTRPRLLVADNLEAEGRRALEAAIHLAETLDCAEICHSHVHRLSIAEVEHMVDKVKEAMNLGKIPANADFSSKVYIDEIRGKIAEGLKYRFHTIQGAEVLKNRYDTAVYFGDPSVELHKAVQQRHSQLIIFGRHHLFHGRRFSLGKIPYSAMIEDGVATLIVPDLDMAALAASS